MSIPQDRPAYRILAVYGFFGPDDHLYPEGDCIVYDGEPNEEMEPLNEPAREQMKKYLDKLDELGRKAAEKFGRTFTGRPRTLDGAIALARQDEELKFKVRGIEKDNTGINKVEPEPVAEVGNANPKKRGRPYKGVVVNAA